MAPQLKAGLRAVDEDAFLWEEEAEDQSDPGLKLSEAEEIGLHLFGSVGLQSCLLLEDPNELFARHLGDRALIQAYRASTTAREVRSEDFASNFFELTPDGGRVGFETNPDHSPALVRVVIENGRGAILLPRALAMVRHIGNMTIQELPPFQMTEQSGSANATNKYYRLITADRLAFAHDVACLIVWAEPNQIAPRVELLCWPIEKRQ